MLRKYSLRLFHSCCRGQRESMAAGSHAHRSVDYEYCITGGVSNAELERISKAWTQKAKLMTFSDAVLAKIQESPIGTAQKRAMVRKWMSMDPNTMSNAQACRNADALFGKKNAVSLTYERLTIQSIFKNSLHFSPLGLL